MNKLELYKNTGRNSENVYDTLYANYYDFVYRELCRIAKPPALKTIEQVIQNTYVRLSDIDMECNIEHLVFNCLRNLVIHDEVNHTDKFSDMEIEQEKMRCEFVMSFLSSKEIIYFIEKYYLLKDDIATNKRYEKKILHLFNGKGIIKFRFEHFKIKKRNIKSEQLIYYLDYLDVTYLASLLDKNSKISISKNTIPATILLVEREYRIARYSVPISIIFIVILAAFFILSNLI